MQLDRKDRGILELLEKNARQSATEIGRSIGLSRTAVKDRIGKLEGAGIIQGYRAVLMSPGQESVEALIFVKFARRPCDLVLDWLVTLKAKGVQEIYSLSGSWDAVVRINVHSAGELSELNDCIERHALIAESTSQVILKSL